MNRKQSIHYAIAVFALLLGSTLAFTHKGFEHVMGTVTALNDTSITVDTVKHASVTVLINPSTKFSRNNVQASLKDVKIGDRVVIDAKPDHEKKLVGVSVKLGAKASTGHGDHKK